MTGAPSIQKQAPSIRALGNFSTTTYRIPHSARIFGTWRASSWGTEKQLQVANSPDQSARRISRHRDRSSNLPHTEKPRELSRRNLSSLVPGLLRCVRQIWNLVSGGNFKKTGQLLFHQRRVSLRNPASPDHFPNRIVGLHTAEYCYTCRRRSHVSHIIGKLQSCKKSLSVSKASANARAILGLIFRFPDKIILTPSCIPSFCKHQITPKTSRYTRCSMSMFPNVSINGRIRSSGQLGRWWYSISPCRNNECVRRFTVFAFNQRS